MRPLKIFGMRINRTEIIGIAIAIVIIILDSIFLYGSDLFYFILGISFMIAGIPFFFFLVFESNSNLEKEAMFIEFARNLVENVRAGTPISKAILNVKSKDYGDLNPYVNKLANQISVGIPIKTALDIFARDLNNTVISRAISIISESEKAGGQIEDILEAVVVSVSQIEKLKKERRSAMYTLVVQGYIIFLIFLVIMIVMEFKILPIATSFNEGFNKETISGLSGLEGMGFGGGPVATPEQLTKPFLWMLIIQGLFTGLVIGKLAEGEVKLGIKHSFVLMVLAILINTGSKLVL